LLNFDWVVLDWIGLSLGLVWIGLVWFGSYYNGMRIKTLDLGVSLDIDRFYSFGTENGNGK